MQKQSLELTISSPLKELFEGLANSLTAPAAYGYLEILPGHAKLTALIKNGKVTAIDQAANVHTFEVKGGVLSVLNNKVSLLLDDEI